MVYGAARVCKGINLRGREAYATVPNKATGWPIPPRSGRIWLPMRMTTEYTLNIYGSDADV